jgi:PKD repeat protein
MSEPADDQTAETPVQQPASTQGPLEQPVSTPRLSRSPYISLGVAALVVSTVFATVAALSSARDPQAAPAPRSDGAVETNSPETYTTDPSATSEPGAGPDSSARDKSSDSSSASATSSKDGTTTGDGTTSGGQTTTTPGSPTSPKPPTTTSSAPNRSPVANFTFDCSGLTCDFDGGGASDPDGSISSYSWSFGGSEVTASHTFSNAGTFDVKLTVVDNRGKSATQTKSVTVNAPTTTSSN